MEVGGVSFGWLSERRVTAAAIACLLLGFIIGIVGVQERIGAEEEFAAEQVSEAFERLTLEEPVPWSVVRTAEGWRLIGCLLIGVSAALTAFLVLGDRQALPTPGWAAAIFLPLVAGLHQTRTLGGWKAEAASGIAERNDLLLGTALVVAAIAVSLLFRAGAQDSAA